MIEFSVEAIINAQPNLAKTLRRIEYGRYNLSFNLLFKCDQFVNKQQNLNNPLRTEITCQSLSLIITSTTNYP